MENDVRWTSSKNCGGEA